MSEQAKKTETKTASGKAGGRKADQKKESAKTEAGKTNLLKETGKTDSKKETGKTDTKKETGKTDTKKETGKAAGAAESAASGNAPADLTNPAYYTNRELSWLDFNYRILGEARDRENPLFERLKFLSITASNLDEFFMVRVASLKDMVNAKYTGVDIAGMTAAEQLAEISTKAHKLVAQQYTTLNRSLYPSLKTQNMEVITEHEDLTPEQAAFVDEYFREDVYPVLTPMAMDSARPFPLVRNKTLNLGALISKKGEKKKAQFATVQVPSVLPRIVQLPDAGDGVKRAILLEEIIERNISSLFLNYDVVCAHPYRVMRNADLTIEEEEAEDLLREIQKQIKQRQWGEVIRLEIQEGMDEKLLKILRREFEVSEDDIYRINGPLDLTFLMKLYGIRGFDDFKNPPFTPQPVPELTGETDLFAAIRKHDIFLHHPYLTFDPVVDFVRKAAVDPQVLAIKQTLYRVSGNSPIVAALAQAAENGKQVTVLVELKARFDEENNIVWAKMLEKAGCHVIYGLVGLKTHSKITLVVRREEDGIRRYVHLGTGNYNDTTARIYTDCGILTCDEGIGEDATAVFNMLSGYSEPKSWNHLSVAPIWLRRRFLFLIRREIEHAKAGEDARIIAKMNSLCDREIIAALYEAGMAGVKVDLIIRGICCLKVGIPGVSENITVRSIVGTYLEHARIFSFENGGNEEIYMGSADWMPRNLDKRVEIVFPVKDPAVKEKVRHILDVQLSDTMKARELTAENEYERIDRRGKQLICAQDTFCREAVAATKQLQPADPVQTRVFVPQESAADPVPDAQDMLK